MITVLEKPVPFDGGITLPTNKAISLVQPLTRAEIPKLIKIPLSQHTALSLKPIVKVGDTVLKGQVIAESQAYISTPVHASTSGVVKDIAKYDVPDSSGDMSECIVIETDGKETWKERNPIKDYTSLSPLVVKQKIWQAGIVGLGGAGFSSAAKASFGLTSDLELLIINAAECEPFVSCDESLIRHYAKDVVLGIEILAYALQLNECVIAIQENKIETIKFLKEALSQYAQLEIKLRLISSLYPAGSEKQLIKSITGIEVSAEGLPVDPRVVVYNVGKSIAVKKAIIDDEPLISRIITVSGSGINKPCNLEVLIGTPINEIIEQCGGYNKDFNYLIIGGPMMGFRLRSDHAPIIKTTNCLLVTGSEFLPANTKESACIRCDDCVPVCPVNLQPQQLHWHAKEFNAVRLQDYKLFDCIECGCCSYVCPSHIPLANEFRKAKSEFLNKQQRQIDAEQNKKRYLQKLERIELQKQEKIKKRATVIDKKAGDDLAMKKKREAIVAAVNRVRQKRKQKKS